MYTPEQIRAAISADLGFDVRLEDLRVRPDGREAELTARGAFYAFTIGEGKNGPRVERIAKLEG